MNPTPNVISNTLLQIAALVERASARLDYSTEMGNQEVVDTVYAINAAVEQLENIVFVLIGEPAPDTENLTEKP